MSWKKTPPHRRRLVLNKKLGTFIPIDEDLEMQKLEKEKQDKAREEALDDSDDEPHDD